MTVQLKSVVFDYGNVLGRPQKRADTEALAAVFGAPIDRFEDVYWRDRLAFDQAVITPETYWAGIANALSRGLTDTERERLIEVDNLSWAHPDPIVVDWATALRRAGVRTAVLSNMPVTLRTYLRFCAWLPEFDYSCYSCDIGLVKPAPEIFRHCLEGLGAAPGETLFLDDREENTNAARMLGIHAIQFSSPEQAQCEINQKYNLPVAMLKADCGGRASRSQSSF